MKLKRLFPFLVLSILSLIVLVILLSAGVLQTLPQSEAIENLDPSLQNKFIVNGLVDGLATAAFVLVCVWMGFGINGLLGRIRDASKRRRITTGVIFGSIFLCVALPLLSLILTYTFLSPQKSWLQFPVPPETPNEIAAGFYNKVIIETDSGNYFSCNFSDLVQCWQAEVEPDASMRQTLEGTPSPNVPAPGNAISMVEVPSYPGSSSMIYYAILEDHTVWYLNSQAGSAFFATALLATVMLPILLGSLLILFGIGLTYLLRWLADRIWRNPEINRPNIFEKIPYETPEGGAGDVRMTQIG